MFTVSTASSSHPLFPLLLGQVRGVPPQGRVSLIADGGPHKRRGGVGLCPASSSIVLWYLRGDVGWETSGLHTLRLTQCSSVLLCLVLQYVLLPYLHRVVVQYVTERGGLRVNTVI